MMDIEFDDEKKMGGKLEHPVLNKHIELIRKLAVDSKIMCILKNDTNSGFSIMECCDDWHAHTLTKNECIELSELFKELSEEIN